MLILSYSYSFIKYVLTIVTNHGGVELIDKLENSKDKIIGKVKETTGQITNDNGLKLSGKLQMMNSDIIDNMEEVKEKLLVKANNFVDQAEVSERK
jgi:uncharacterized protein YjbJ (UPF0337 family)